LYCFWGKSQTGSLQAACRVFANYSIIPYDEETYYRFSKCSAGPDAARAQRALRVLLAEE